MTVPQLPPEALRGPHRTGQKGKVQPEDRREEQPQQCLKGHPDITQKEPEPTCVVVRRENQIGEPARGCQKSERDAEELLRQDPDRRPHHQCRHLGVLRRGREAIQRGLAGADDDNAAARDRRDVEKLGAVQPEASEVGGAWHLRDELPGEAAHGQRHEVKDLLFNIPDLGLGPEAAAREEPSSVSEGAEAHHLGGQPQCRSQAEGLQVRDAMRLQLRPGWVPIQNGAAGTQLWEAVLLARYLRPEAEVIFAPDAADVLGALKDHDIHIRQRLQGTRGLQPSDARADDGDLPPLPRQSVVERRCFAQRHAEARAR
eukprot:CAMPEP_0204178900 /NCGR_PEP_ID=MMETSP0361-20130328/49699_1 /ASSEMBLY_ACC=CAM_ASM_000343 /TAXON_ID=268821 /ORGANISM="Scrippsiella Hangoei, Strain SHTV-5" /LENGTH=314 /DNA_ID=CAMNT_0051138083 /DNA_START=727 /DNA_END=1668 /DNA_ORIENTATION=+